MGGIASIVGTVGGGLLGGGFGAALGGSVGGAIDSASAANDAERANRRATDAQLQGIRESNQLQRDMFNAQSQIGSFGRGIGNQALAQLGGLYGLQGGYDPAGTTQFGPDGKPVTTMGAAPAGGAGGSPDFSAFMNSPDYLFAQQEGQRGLDATAAAGGNLFGGGRAVAASRFNQGLASQQFGNYTNRLASLAGIGQTATNQLGQSLQNTGNNISQGLQSAGDVRASGYNTGSNIRSNQLNNLFGLVQGGLNAYGGGSFGGGGFGGGGTGAPAWNYNLG